MKSFREMNQARIGLISVGVVVGAMVLLFNLAQFAFLTGSTTYRAAFADAAGLLKDDPVQLAGTKVGKVRSIELAGDRVVVSFDISNDDFTMGDQTSAAIKTGTLLGRKFLQVNPAGSGELDPDTVIPLERTTTPFTITDQLGNLAVKAGEIDTQQLARSFDTVSDAFAGSPPQMRDALRGLTRISRTISTRDRGIRDLLGNAEGVTGVLADRNHELTKLIFDGNRLLGELERRRAAIRALLINTSNVSDQLRGLVGDNKVELRATLRRLDSVMDVLLRNKGNITLAVKRIAPFASALGEAVASGPFFTAYVENLAASNLAPVPNVGELLEGGR